jgi:hypothetical protein
MARQVWSAIGADGFMANTVKERTEEFAMMMMMMMKYSPSLETYHSYQ